MKNGRLYDGGTLAEVWPRRRELPAPLWRNLEALADQDEASAGGHR